MGENTMSDDEMKEKLQKAGEQAEKEKAARREKTVKGSHLLPQLKELAEARGLTVKENSSFYKIEGKAKGRRVYVARNGGRIDLSGFSIDHSAVEKITEAQAREKHIGKVRGVFNFDESDDSVIEAYGMALDKLEEAPAGDAEKTEAAQDE